MHILFTLFFFFNDTATTEIYTLSLHDALPISSGLKTFVLQYRNAEGRSRRIVIGRYGVLTVEKAREQAQIKLGAVAGGADPAEERAASREAMTVADLCDWYLVEAEAGHILGRRNRP